MGAEGYGGGPEIPFVRRLGPAVQIALHVEPNRWPAAIAAIPDPDERKWADHWLRQQAQIMRARRARLAVASKDKRHG